MKKVKNYEESIAKIIKECGIPASLLGYHYIRYAINLVINDITLITQITKVLYPKVAEKFNTTTVRADRAIRNAIETGWIRANEDLVMEVFGYSISASKGKPTNSEFIANIADYIILKHIK